MAAKGGFYLPHMEYEGSIGLVSRKMKKKITGFSSFRTLIDLGEKKFRRSPAVAVERKICATLQLPPFKARNLKFWLP
jgi:hypothetical protein